MVDWAIIIAITTSAVNLLAIIAAVFKVGRAVEKFESIGTQQAYEIRELKDAVKVVSELITKMALQGQRLDTQSQRLVQLEKIVDDLRRGEGMILPLFPKSGQ